MFVFNLLYILGGYPCNQCGKVYKHKESLWTHKNYECNKEPTFKCPRCPLITKRKYNLKKHVRYSHGEDIIILNWMVNNIVRNISMQSNVILIN